MHPFCRWCPDNIYKKNFSDVNTSICSIFSCQSVICYSHYSMWPVLNHKICLKVLTHEKRGGLKEASFDRSRFKLFTLRFSKIFVQAENYTQRCLFLLFEYNSWFPNKVLISGCVTIFTYTLHWNNGDVSLPVWQRTQGEAQFYICFGWTAKN